MEKIKINITELKCKRCGHMWYPRKKDVPPRCPKCKSPYWQREKIKKDK